MWTCFSSSRTSRIECYSLCRTVCTVYQISPYILPTSAICPTITPKYSHRRVSIAGHRRQQPQRVHLCCPSQHSSLPFTHPPPSPLDVQHLTVSQICHLTTPPHRQLPQHKCQKPPPPPPPNPGPPHPSAPSQISPIPQSQAQAQADTASHGTPRLAALGQRVSLAPRRAEEGAPITRSRRGWGSLIRLARRRAWGWVRCRMSGVARGMGFMVCASFLWIPFGFGSGFWLWR